MIRRRARRDESEPEYTPEEVDQLTARPEELLGQLHEVLGEMADRLQSLSGNEGE